MTTIESFVNRLAKIGIDIELVGNYPWVYLDKVNGKKVQGTYMANHGFTVFFLSSKEYEENRITSIKEVFKKIRETISQTN